MPRQRWWRRARQPDAASRLDLDALAASFAPKFAHLLPPELVRRVVEYAFHVGYY